LVYGARQHISTHTGAGSCRRWEKQLIILVRSGDSEPLLYKEYRQTKREKSTSFKYRVFGD
jgi:hypothetical protein